MLKHCLKSMIHIIPRENLKQQFRGSITVPTSDDARYGWWIYQDETCDQLVKLIKKGKNAKLEPVYYQDGSFVYTGMKGARTADSDIGKTYIEIDLTQPKPYGIIKTAKALGMRHSFRTDNFSRKNYTSRSI